MYYYEAVKFLPEEGEQVHIGDKTDGGGTVVTIIAIEEPVRLPDDASHPVEYYDLVITRHEVKE